MTQRQDVMTAGPIVVGIDGSESSRQALAWAVDYARRVGAPVEAVTAWHYPNSFGYGVVPDDWNPEQDAQRLLADTVTSVVGRDSLVTQHIREGVTARVLLDESKDARMLVVGSRGHGGFAGLLLGSVSSACAEHATCPVLVFHATAP